MKGKGKDTSSDSKDCLQFLNFSPQDASRSYPKYTSITSMRKTDDLLTENVTSDEIDCLQNEVETMLVNLIKRKSNLEKESQMINAIQEKKDIKRVSEKEEHESSGKKSKPSEGKSGGKKYKDSTGKIHSPQVGRPPKKPRIEEDTVVTPAPTPGKVGRPRSVPSSTKLQEYDFTDSPDVHKPIKSDLPHRFWQAIEPFCREVSQSDLKFIEDLIASQTEDQDLFKIPPLGLHYSIKWAQDEIHEDQKDCKRRNFNNNTSLNSTDSDKNILKNVDKNCESEETSPFGALTQRLVSCLIENHLGGAPDISILDKDSGDTTQSKANFIKSLNTGNTLHLENKIKKELEEQGILDSDNNENPEDEVLAEIKKCQSELKVVNSINVNLLKKLAKLVKEEVARNEVKKKIDALDVEILEGYKKYTAAKQKKKSFSKKEKDALSKVIKDRDNLVKQLESM